MDATDETKHAVRPRQAASLLVVREWSGGAEVLMGVRAPAHRFMPNRLAFPGGSVERGDFVTEPASGLRPATAQLLGKSSGPRLARALAIAAARELSEETGLSLGTPPSLAGFAYLCRAITPPSFPIRFHARFLVITAEAAEGSLGGSGELEGLRYYALGETFSQMASITARVLAELESWLALSVEERFALRPTAAYRRLMRHEE